MEDKPQISPEILKETLQIQLSELESLESMFYNPGELKIEDLLTFADMKNYVSGKSKYVPPNLDITINLEVDNSKFELCVMLPHEYPTTMPPEVFVRNPELCRVQHKNINKDLAEYIADLDRGDPCIFSAILWLQDNASKYKIKRQTETLINDLQEKNDSLMRLWIYSHHIYSKTKRKEILDQANLLGLSGFTLPGKPGIICVEGPENDCNEWWQTIKAMNWKKIFCKVTEVNKDMDTNEKFLQFDNFQEISFPNSGIKGNHTDMGELYKYLQGHNVAYIFKELFGIEGK